MQTSDLTRLPDVKVWLQNGPTPTATDDPLLGRLITAASQWVQTYLSRKIPPADYTYVANGLGTSSIFLPNQPILTISSLVIGQNTISASTPGSSATGYVFDENCVYVQGWLFPRGFQNITIKYTAGFQTSDSVTVPTGAGAYPVANLARPWNADRGVVYASDGTALTLVASNPSTGQYAIVADEDTETYSYDFAPGDAGAALTVTYGYTPEDLYQAVLEIVSERAKYRTRLGLLSQGMAQQTTNFIKEASNANVLQLLNQYRNVTPVQGSP